MSDYGAFLARKAQLGGEHGFAPSWLPGFLFDFQAALVEWACRKGRAAIFADCGLGKTPMQLVWAENVVRHTGGHVLVVTPLAVSHQTIREGEKFGIGVRRSADGHAGPGITVTNYERLAHFRAMDFVGVVADESSILKSFEGKTRAAVTEFVRRLPYRLLCTATAAPNDYIELGTSSEALGDLGYMDMLGRFFRNEQNTAKPVRRWTAQKYGWASLSVGGDRGLWRLKGHAEGAFWRWVCSWARAIRRPSDLGYPDDGFVLPPLTERQHEVASLHPADGMLFDLPAVGLHEQRQERRRTLSERCARVAELVRHARPALVWCHLNAESDRLAAMIPEAEQITGDQSDDEKEARWLAFLRGDLRVVVSKPKIGAYGLNLQHCAHIAMFPSHSWEQYYQGVRRCWRYGQRHPVVVDLVTTPGEASVLANLQRKARAADAMFERLVEFMRESVCIGRSRDEYPDPAEIPAWLS